MLEIFKSTLVNISLLVMVAYLLTKIPTFQKFIIHENNRLGTKLALAVVFGLIGILSTYTGFPVEGAIANTRVVGVVVGGLLGGPIVGIGAGMIAGVHRWGIDIGGFTAIACAVSTITEGLIGGMFHRYVRRSREDTWIVGAVAMVAEIIQMAIILLVARPFDRAWQLVSVIGLPMIFVNSVGVMIFIGVINSVFIEQDRESGRRMRLVMEIADRCLPHLRRGLYDRTHLNQAVEIIYKHAEIAGVAITDTHTILSHAGKTLESISEGCPLPALAEDTIRQGDVCIAEEADTGDVFYKSLKKHTAVCAQLTQRGEVIGTLVVFTPKFKLSLETECVFVHGLAKLFSTQLELSQVEYQKKLLQKAEFAALQSQINPHFLFNALSTITAFCREKPERARELLIVLSNYFRNTLQADHDIISLSDELAHVEAYLQLEKARFEEKLQIKQDIPADLDCTVPSFILQPLVENAVKHGAMSGAGTGIVQIKAYRKENDTLISVRDNGAGIPPEVVRQMYDGSLAGGSVGLSNVHKRLKCIYGEEYGLQIQTGTDGTEVLLRIPCGIKPIGGVSA